MQLGKRFRFRQMDFHHDAISTCWRGPERELFVDETRQTGKEGLFCLLGIKIQQELVTLILNLKGWVLLLGFLFDQEPWILKCRSIEREPEFDGKTRSLVALVRFRPSGVEKDV